MRDITFDSFAYHRNGSDGAGHYVAIVRAVDDDGCPRRFLVTQFPDADDLGYGPDGATAAVDLDLAALGVVSSDANAWRSRAVFGQAMLTEAARWRDTPVEALRVSDEAAARLASALPTTSAARLAAPAADD